LKDDYILVSLADRNRVVELAVKAVLEGSHRRVADQVLCEVYYRSMRSAAQVKCSFHCDIELR
jgi:coenzyme F420-reducing hydrogenase gamma subunit